jgi:hypothetical protein
MRYQAALRPDRKRAYMGHRFGLQAVTTGNVRGARAQAGALAGPRHVSTTLACAEAQRALTLRPTPSGDNRARLFNPTAKMRCFIN